MKSVNIVKLPDNRLPKAAYETVKSLDDKGVKIWASDIRTCLFQYGLGIVWVSQQVGNKTGFLRELKQRLIDCYAQDWHEKMSTKERFENYRGFKQILQFESCLSYLTIKRYRGARVRIQLGVNELACNKYRYNPNVSQRLCPVCESAEEFEMHLIFACRAYDNISKDPPLICYKETQR